MSYCTPIISKSFFTTFGALFTISFTSGASTFVIILKNKSYGTTMFGITLTVSSYVIFLFKILVIIAFSVRSFLSALCLSISRRSLCSLKVSLLVDTRFKTSMSHPTPQKDLRWIKKDNRTTNSSNIP